MSWSSLIIGLIIGWAAEWVIDWVYWRRRTSDGSVEADNLRAQNKRLRADLDVAAEPVERLKADLAATNEQLSASRTELANLRAQPSAAPAAAAPAADLSGELQRLHARRIVERGEAAFLSDPLAQLRADHARLSEQPPAASAPAANTFATQQMSAAEVQAALELEGLRAENRQLQAENERLAAQISAGAPVANTFATQQMSAAEVQAALAAEQRRSAPNTFATQQLSAAEVQSALAAEGQARSRAVGESDDSARLRADLADANGQLAQLRAELAALRGKPARDPLIDINGIGPVIEKRLFEAGILTFAQLAAESPARLREIARLKEWQDADPNAWIAEARQRAGQQSEG